MMNLFLDIAPRPPKDMGLDMYSSSAMLWIGTIALLALALCFYGICAYRKQTGRNSSQVT